VVAPVLEDFAQVAEHDLPLLAFFLVFVVAHVVQHLLEFLGSGGVFGDREGRVDYVALGSVLGGGRTRWQHFIAAALNTLHHCYSLTSERVSANYLASRRGLTWLCSGEPS